MSDDEVKRTARPDQDRVWAQIRVAQTTFGQGSKGGTNFRQHLAQVGGELIQDRVHRFCKYYQA